MTEESIEAEEENVEVEMAAANDQPDSVTRGPRLSANGTEADDGEESDKPKKSGWWSRRSFF